MARNHFSQLTATVAFLWLILFVTAASATPPMTQPLPLTGYILNWDVFEAICKHHMLEEVVLSRNHIPTILASLINTSNYAHAIRLWNRLKTQVFYTLTRGSQLSFRAMNFYEKMRIRVLTMNLMADDWSERLPYDDTSYFSLRRNTCLLRNRMNIIVLNAYTPDPEQFSKIRGYVEDAMGVAKQLVNASQGNCRKIILLLPRDAPLPPIHSQRSLLGYRSVDIPSAMRKSIIQGINSVLGRLRGRQTTRGSPGVPQEWVWKRAGNIPLAPPGGFPNLYRV